MRSLPLLTTVIVFCLTGSAALASSEVKHPMEIRWSFDGVFGKFDRPAIQRGLQVYREVCSSCHGLKRVAYRTLEGVGFSEAEVKALAAEYEYTDGPNDEGDMYERPGKPSDKFQSPFANEKAARASNNGALPPDMSLIIKARPNGANYVYSLLTGYESAPAHAHIGEGQYYNPYFAGGAISMAPPLMRDAVEYQDGTAATVDQMAKDVVNFLQWAAEPEMEDRKRMGVKTMLFLLIFTLLFYVAKKRVWRDLH